MFVSILNLLDTFCVSYRHTPCDFRWYTTVVVRRDDGRRSSNDPLTPCDGRRLTAHTTPTVGYTHNGRQQLKQIANLADIRLSANENRSSAASDVATSQQEIIQMKKTKQHRMFDPYHPCPIRPTELYLYLVFTIILLISESDG